MKEIEGDLYCGGDYERETAIINEEKLKDKLNHPEQIDEGMIKSNEEQNRIYDRPSSGRLEEERPRVLERGGSRYSSSNELDQMVFQSFVKKLKSVGGQSPKPSHF